LLYYIEEYKMDSRYVKLADQTSFTGDKKALEFLPKDVQAIAFRATDVGVMGKPVEIVTPSSALTSKEADLLQKSKMASGLMSEDLMQLLQKEYTAKRVGSPTFKQEFSGLGQADLLKKAQALTTGVAAGLKTLTTDPAAVKAAEEAKAKEEQAIKIKMVAGIVVLGALAYFLFFRKS